MYYYTPPPLVTDGPLSYPLPPSLNPPPVFPRLNDSPLHLSLPLHRVLLLTKDPLSAPRGRLRLSFYTLAALRSNATEGFLLVNEGGCSFLGPRRRANIAPELLIARSPLSHLVMNRCFFFFRFSSPPEKAPVDPYYHVSGLFFLVFAASALAHVAGPFSCPEFDEPGLGPVRKRKA